MFGYSRLGVAGTPAAASLVVIAAIGSAAGQTVFDTAVGTSLGITEAVAAASGTSTATGEGAARFDAVGAAQGREVGAGAVGASNRAGVAAAAGTCSAVGYPRIEWSSLAVTALPGAYYSVESKVIIGLATWTIQDTLGVNVAFNDFTDFTFTVPEILAYSFAETASISGATGLATGISSVIGIGSYVVEATAAAAGTATATGFGQGIITLAGVGAADGTCAIDFRGSNVSANFSVGIGAAAGACTVTWTGAATAAATFAEAGTCTVAGSATGFMQGVGNAAGTCTVTATPSTGGVGSASGTSTAAAASALTTQSVATAAGSSTAIWVSQQAVVGEITRIMLRPRAGSITLRADAAAIVLNPRAKAA